MATYYVQPGYQRPRAYSQSYGHAPQQIVYTHSNQSHHSSPQRRATAYPHHSGAYYAAPQYVAPTYHHDSGRHHHQGHARAGSGGVYYTSSAPSHSRHSPSSGQRRSASHTRHHRSQSVPRTVQVVDARRPHHTRSSSRLRQSPPHQAHHSRPVGEPLSERIRRMFGFGHSSSRPHNRDYVDARSGRTVDWRGRPIYRV
ncbi:hypothetical protein VTO73DRAFT_14656 [Trametes versicolor]